MSKPTKEQIEYAKRTLRREEETVRERVWDDLVWKWKDPDLVDEVMAVI